MTIAPSREPSSRVDATERPPDSRPMLPPEGEATVAAGGLAARIWATWRRWEDATERAIEHGLGRLDGAMPWARLTDTADRLAARLDRLGARAEGLGGHVRRPPPLVVGGAVGVIALAVLVVVAGVGRRDEPTARPAAKSSVAEAPVTPAAPARTSVEAQTAARRLGVFAETTMPGIAEPGAVATTFEEPFRLEPPFDAIDSVVFDADTRRFRLWGVWPVARNEICRDENGGRVACGLMARAALQNHIARQKLVCRRMFGAASRNDFIEVSCGVDGEDLATRMVRIGYAFPSPRSGPAEAEALAEATAAKRGYWNGPQVAPTADRAAEDARAIPIGGTRLQPVSADMLAPAGPPTSGDPARRTP